jgi:chorismate mutase
MKEIEKLRKKIDKLDDKIIPLLEKRYAIRQKIWSLKKLNSFCLRDKKREKEIISKFKNSRLPKSFIKDFFELFFHETQ